VPLEFFVDAVRVRRNLGDCMLHDPFETGDHGAFAELQPRPDDTAVDTVRVDIGIKHVSPGKAGHLQLDIHDENEHPLLPHGRRVGVHGIADVVANLLAQPGEEAGGGNIDRARFLPRVSLRELSILDGSHLLPLAERGVVNACVVKNPVGMRTELLRLPIIRDVDTEGNGNEVPLQILQSMQKLHPVLMGQRAGGIHHAGELDEAVAKNSVSPAETIAARRALIISAGVNGGIAAWADGHTPYIAFFASEVKSNHRHREKIMAAVKNIDSEGKKPCP